MKLSNTSPYADIKKEQLVYGDTMTSKAYGVKIEAPYENTNNPQIMANGETGWKEIGIVSSDYLLVPNKTMVQMADAVMATSDLDFEEDKQFWNGKQFFKSWKAVDEIDAEVQVGDNLGVGAGIWNSYDGSTSGRFILFAYRLACRNGMLSKHNFAEYIFKHDIYNKDWKHEVEKTSKVLANAGEDVKSFALKCSKLSETYMRLNSLGSSRTKELSNFGVTDFGKIVDRFLTKEEYAQHSAWDLLNSGTDIFWHNKKQTVSDFKKNRDWVDGCLALAA